MDAVLGLSMTPTTVGLVLVEGQDADGATMDRDAFAVRSGGRSSAIEMSEQAAAAVLRTEAMAATRGHRLHSIGVTWSEDADAEASMLLRSLSESGFDNVIAVRLPEATEALARGIAEAIGYDTTAVCRLEADTAIAMVVHLHDGSVETTARHIDDEESLMRWLSTVFAKAAWEPEALVMVGSDHDLDDVMIRLEDTLGVPVFAPAEAEVALARGAALASAQATESPFTPLEDGAANTPTHRPGHRWMVGTGPMALLVGGTVTFVVSVSMAISLQLTAGEAPQRDSRPAANTAGAPAAVQQQVPMFPPPVAIPPDLPEAPPPPTPEALFPPEAPAEPAPEFVPEETLPQAEVPAPEAIPPAPVIAPPPEGMPPPAPVVPTKKPGILTRIKDKLTPGNDNDFQPPADLAPPPVDPLAPLPPPP